MQAYVKLALGGGGGAEDSRPLDEAFAAWIRPEGRLLYWPVALRGIRPLDTCLAWIEAIFAPLGVTDVTMWTELAEHQPGEIETFDGIYVGGGNTFSLLAELRESGFDRALRDYALSGGPVYGGSAGAAVLGCDIRTVSHLDANHIGLTDTRGLDLAGGHAVWVHYVPEDDERIQAYVQERRQPVLAISERSGVAIDGDGMRGVGFEPAYRFAQRADEPVELPTRLEKRGI